MRVTIKTATSATKVHRSNAARVLEWGARYGPAEVLSTLATLLAAFMTRHAGAGAVKVALAATWAGNVVYYSCILAQDGWATRRALQRAGHRYSAGATIRNVVALVVEFGPAEVLDALLIRPAMMFWMPRWLHSEAAGVLVGKLVADCLFYVPAIVSYELSKQRLRRI